MIQNKGDKDEYIIGLMGCLLDSSNMGCVALTYSTLYLFEQIAKKEGISTRYYLFARNQRECEMHKCEKTLGITPGKIEYYEIWYKNIDLLKQMWRALGKCKIIFDLTMGDSFSDIYGQGRFKSEVIGKIITIINHKPLLLGPQTYGPFEKNINKLISKWVIERSKYVLSRDYLSIRYCEKLQIHKKIEYMPDMAFYLPVEKKELAENKIKVGLNVSGLLYSGGYTKNNQFGLNLDYKMFCEGLIEKISSDERYIVYIIPHVISEVEDSGVDDDLKVSMELCRRHKNIEMAPVFQSPIEAKSFIACMDIFIGARMHATIAAFSTGVVTIPIAYSRKFEGLFGAFGYNYIVDAKSTTDEALAQTLEYVKGFEKIRKVVKEKGKKIEEDKIKLENKLTNILVDG